MKKPFEAQLLEFLRGNLGKRALAPLTGTDFRALLAAAAIIEAYSGDGHPSYLTAFALIVQRMQRQCWFFAYHAIAKSLDWDDRMGLWLKAGLPTEPLEHTPRCEMEPAGRGTFSAAKESLQIISRDQGGFTEIFTK